MAVEATKGQTAEKRGSELHYLDGHPLCVQCASLSAGRKVLLLGRAARSALGVQGSEGVPDLFRNI